jgi:hypothetical protein
MVPGGQLISRIPGTSLHSLPAELDALDTMVLGATNLDALDVFTMVDHQPFDPTIKRTESVSGVQPAQEKPACQRWAWWLLLDRLVLKAGSHLTASFFLSPHRPSRALTGRPSRPPRVRPTSLPSSLTTSTSWRPLRLRCAAAGSRRGWPAS